MSKDNLITIRNGIARIKNVSHETFEGDDKTAIDNLFLCLQNLGFENFYIDYDVIRQELTLSIRYSRIKHPNGYFFTQLKYDKKFFIETPIELICNLIKTNYEEYKAKC